MSTNEANFKELAVKSQQGDGKAYKELLIQISSFLKNYLRKRIFSANEIDEVSQEVLLAVHKSLHTFHTEKSFMGWFMSIVEYKVIDYIRSTEKSKSIENIDDIPDIALFVSSNSDLKLDLESGMNQLSEKEQNILTLLKIDGQSVSAVASQLNLSETNVKVIAHRAYSKLRQHLGADT